MRVWLQEKEGRLEGRAAGRVCICHLLLLQAKKTQEEQQKYEKEKKKRWDRIPIARNTFKRGLSILRLNPITKYSFYSSEMPENLPSEESMIHFISFHFM